MGYLVGEVFENEQIQSETVVFLAACCVMPFFVAGGSNCSLGNDCVSEFISELPSTAESLLEQAKRLRCEYTKIANKRRKRLRKERY